jgi:endonuclease YncB( thermonuclease family)
MNRLIILVALALLPFAAVAADLKQGPRARVVVVVDGDTVELDNGMVVRLVGIQAPKLPLGRPGFEAWPLADEAKATLVALVMDVRVSLHYGGRQVDRHGRQLAHLYTNDGVWVQGELLRLGMARVYSFRDNRALVAAMLALEAEARANGRGIWSDDYYAVRKAEPPRLPIDRFELVEGLVVAATIVRGRAYLNFGPDWKTDFTASVDPRDRRLFDDIGFDIEALQGHRVRVRGWVESWNGSMIEISHPEQIEVLDP